jgi:hypothetical protein
MKWLDITKELTKKGQKDLLVGQVLIFSYEGSPVHLKIKRKHKGKVWAERVYLYHPDEVEIKDKVE